MLLHPVSSIVHLLLYSAVDHSKIPLVNMSHCGSHFFQLWCVLYTQHWLDTVLEFAQGCLRERKKANMTLLVVKYTVRENVWSDESAVVCNGSLSPLYLFICYGRPQLISILVSCFCCLLLKKNFLFLIPIIPHWINIRWVEEVMICYNDHPGAELRM